jgi:NAD(P)-dependent dehydrogenase (short-subunit alcohol dehydrogenase family)
MTTDLTGKVAYVTGAARGQGRSVVSGWPGPGPMW